jgi:hypothetical protein
MRWQLVETHQKLKGSVDDIVEDIRTILKKGSVVDLSLSMTNGIRYLRHEPDTREELTESDIDARLRLLDPLIQLEGETIPDLVFSTMLAQLHSLGYAPAFIAVNKVSDFFRWLQLPKSLFKNIWEPFHGIQLVEASSLAKDAVVLLGMPEDSLNGTLFDVRAGIIYYMASSKAQPVKKSKLSEESDGRPVEIFATPRRNS